MKVLHDIESAVPVEDWTIDGVHVWPVIRIQLGMDLFASGQATCAPSVHAKWKCAPKLARRYFRYIRACLIDHAAKVDIKKTQAILFGDGVSFTTFSGKYFERFCDPLRAELHALGIDSLTITPLDRFFVPRFSPSKFIQPRLDWVQAMHRLSWRHTIRKEFMPGIEAMLEQLGREAPAVAPKLDGIRRHCSLALAFSRYFDRLLSRAEPKICFIVSYYWLVGYGLLLACRRRGIPTVDIQHGVQGPMHFAYGGWSKVPSRGYELLPNYFWCWTEEDASVIRQWTQLTGGAHQPVVGGNLFLNQCKLMSLSSDSPCEKNLQEISAGLAQEKQVLVTLQPGLLTDRYIRFLQDAIEETASHLHWWIRIHPGMLEERSKVQQLFGHLRNVEIDKATDSPLYWLLWHMAVHVTHSSSTVLEACEFGIRSVVCSRYGMELFADLERQRVVMYAGNKEELLSAVDIQRRERRSVESVVADGKKQIEGARKTLASLAAHAGI